MPQLDWCPVIILRQLIIFEASRDQFRRGLEPIFESRLARFNVPIESLAEHAHWTEFHRSRKFTAAVRADVSALRAHGANRPPDATTPSQSAWTPPSTSAGSETLRPPPSRNAGLYRL